MGWMGQEQAKEYQADDKALLRFGITALILGNVFLAFGPWFVRLADTGPIASAFWRTLIATPPLAILAFWLARPTNDAALGAGSGRIPIGLYLGAGAIFAADLAAWHLGILQTKLANSNLLGNSTAFLFPLWGFIAMRVWPSRMQGTALAMAGVGAALLMGRSYELSPANLVGDLLCFTAGAFYTCFLVMMARVRETGSPWTVLAWSTAMTPLPLLIFALIAGEKIMPGNWWPLITLAVSSQIIGQGLMIYVVGRISPLVMGLSLLLQPMIGAVLGWVWYGEKLAPMDWIGALLIGLALVLVSQPDRAKVNRRTA